MLASAVILPSIDVNIILGDRALGVGDVIVGTNDLLEETRECNLHPSAHLFSKRGDMRLISCPGARCMTSRLPLRAKVRVYLTLLI